MSRRNISRKQQAEVELFPFLSVLACTIGTLVLLIIVLTTQAGEPQEATIVAKTDENSQGSNGKKNSIYSGRNKTPVYIEARKDGFVLHPSKQFAPRTELYDEKSTLRKTIANLKANKNKQYLILVLRPDGLEMFDKARQLVRGEGIDIGYEPLEYGLELKIEN
jgi:biopolymer transport protein ExbD